MTEEYNPKDYVTIGDMRAAINDTATRIAERQATALERIADALEILAAGKATAATGGEAWLAAQAKAQETADGWVEWHGGDCPLPGQVPVEVRLRTEYGYRNPGVFRAMDWAWQNGPKPSLGDIVAYRVHKDTDE